MKIVVDENIPNRNPELFHDVEAINEHLGDTRSAAVLFKQIEARKLELLSLLVHDYEEKKVPHLPYAAALNTASLHDDEAQPATRSPLCRPSSAGVRGGHQWLVIARKSGGPVDGGRRFPPSPEQERRLLSLAATPIRR